MKIQNEKNYMRVKTLFNENRYQEAIKFLSKKLKAKPLDHTLYALRARAFQKVSNPQRAAEDFYQASKLDKNSKKYQKDARQGLLDIAFNNRYQAYLRHPEDENIQHDLINLMMASPDVNKFIHENEFEILLSDLVQKVPSSQHQNFATQICHPFVFSELNSLNLEKIFAVGSFDKNKKTIIESLMQNKIILFLLSSNVNTDVFFELFIRKIRTDLLRNFTVYKNLKNFRIFYNALSKQLYLNEFIYDETEEEAQTIEAILQDIASKDINNLEWDEVERLALYKDLYEIPSLKKANFPKHLKAIFSMHISSRCLEKEIASSIEECSVFENKISQKVQDQYTKNPYPRWEFDGKFKQKNQSLLQYLELAVRQEINSPIFSKEIKNVLIAGCGTGQQILQLARNTNDINITAIDLSINSLSYAKRIVTEIGIKNVHFIKKDILTPFPPDIENFDYIECGGVLHHLENPENGLARLCEQLNSGGMMMLALYSRKGRQPLEVVKDFIKSNSMSFEQPDKAIYLREYLISQAAKGEKHASDFCRLSGDFYSLSGYRDLLFHVKEHVYDLDELSEMFRKAKLKFVGISHTPGVVRSLKHWDGELKSLDDWSNLEDKYPSTFDAMYHILLQKP